MVFKFDPKNTVAPDSWKTVYGDDDANSKYVAFLAKILSTWKKEKKDSDNDIDGFKIYPQTGFTGTFGQWIVKSVIEKNNVSILFN